MLISVDEEIEAQYDLHPQQITGLPHGTELPDSTPTTVIKASRELKRLRKKKNGWKTNYKISTIGWE